MIADRCTTKHCSKTKNPHTYANTTEYFRMEQTNNNKKGDAIYYYYNNSNNNTSTLYSFVGVAIAAVFTLPIVYKRANNSNAYSDTVLKHEINKFTKLMQRVKKIKQTCMPTKT